jgi:hypothetical protein
MPRAVAVSLSEPALQISASPGAYQSHFSRAGERNWPETNWYLDLWIETLPLLGWIRCPHSPVPCPPTTMASNEHFLTTAGGSPPALGLGVTEEIVWLPPRETVSVDAPGWIPSTTSFVSGRQHATPCAATMLWIPLYRNDYGECTITLPGEVDGHRVRVGCDVVAIEDVQDSLAAFGTGTCARFLRRAKSTTVRATTGCADWRPGSRPRKR